MSEIKNYITRKNEDPFIQELRKGAITREEIVAISGAKPVTTTEDLMIALKEIHLERPPVMTHVWGLAILLNTNNIDNNTNSNQ